MTQRRVPKWLTRDFVLFVAGLSGITYETVWDKTDRPTLLVLFGAMVGLPALLHVDESRAKRRTPATRDEDAADEDSKAS